MGGECIPDHTIFQSQGVYLAINALLPENKIDPATVKKQKIETVEKPLPNEKVAKL
ncbi:MAG: hypothetical protein ACKOEV_14445 [Cytophagales bacterium]